MNKLATFLIVGCLTYAAALVGTETLGKTGWRQKESGSAVEAMGTSSRVTRDPHPVREEEEPAEEAPQDPALAEVEKPCVEGVCPQLKDSKEHDCPHDMICKNGHCYKPYAIVFSTKGCAPCIRMWPTIQSLRKQGFPVYYFHDNYKDVAREFNIRLFPTTLIMKDGKEHQRYTGFTDEHTIAKALK